VNSNINDLPPQNRKNDPKESTIIGDVVMNLASRLKQATKDFNARLLISEAVRRSSILPRRILKTWDSSR
jgi:class 3 adenylate cyclase